MMLERQREGIAKAKAEGKYKGRQPTARAKAEKVPGACSGGLDMGQIAVQLGIGKGSVPPYPIDGRRGCRMRA